MEPIKTQVFRLDDIKPAPYNPRVELTAKDREFKALTASIEQHGLVQPLIVNIRDGYLIGGHQRLNVLKAAGETETEAVVVDLDEAHAKALCLALNKLDGEWDYGILYDIMNELREAGADTLSTGFTDREIDDLIVVIEQPDELKEKELCLALNKIKGRWDTEKTGELLRDDAVLNFETGFDLDEVKSYRAIEEATATDGDDLDELEDDTEEPDTLDELEEVAEDELEDDTEEPEAYGTSAKIGQIKIKLTADEYDELLNGIRDDGIFAEKDISAEMKRRILKND